MAMDCKGCRVPNHKKEDCDYFKKDPKMCNCQHRRTVQIKVGDDTFTAPEGVTGIVSR